MHHTHAELCSSSFSRNRLFWNLSIKVCWCVFEYLSACLLWFIVCIWQWFDLLPSLSSTASIHHMWKNSKTHALTWQKERKTIFDKFQLFTLSMAHFEDIMWFQFNVNCIACYFNDGYCTLSNNDISINANDTKYGFSLSLCVCVCNI